MEVKTIDRNEGTVIEVRSEKPAAVIIESEGDERIFLPPADHESSTYYIEKPETMVKTDKGYSVFFTGKIDNLKAYSVS